MPRITQICAVRVICVSVRYLINLWDLAVSLPLCKGRLGGDIVTKI